MRRDEIEFVSEIGQWNSGVNTRDNPMHVQQLSCAAKERFFIGIEADCLVTEETTDVEEISRTASKIENPERRGPIQPKILGALDVDADPVGGVFVRVDLSRIRPVWITFAEPGKFRAIKRRQNSPRANGMRPTAEMLPKAFRRVEGKELLKLARKLHAETMPLTALQTSWASV